MNKFFENDSIEFLKLRDDKIHCLNYFGYRLSGSRHTYICNNYTKPHVVYIKQINEMTIYQLFDFLAGQKA